MTLLLTIRNVEALDNGEATTLRLARHGAVIGRSPHADWSLPDAKNHISSRHCEISYRNGAYLLSDRSTNGTYVNGDAARLSAPHPLRDGDVIVIGHYEIVVQAGEGPVEAPPPAPSVAEPAVASGWGTWDAPAPAADPALSAWSDPRRAAITGQGPMSQNWAPPRVEAPARGDLDWGVPTPAPNPPSAWSSDPREPAPATAADIWGKLASDNEIDWSRGGFSAPAPALAEGIAQPRAEVPISEAPPIAAGATPVAEPSPSDGWTAFLAAAGIESPGLKAAPGETLAAAGAVVRQLVNGLVLIVDARARAKAQLGVQATAFEPEGNNPLKFIRSPEQALLRLLEPPEQGFMGAPAAVEDAFRDIQAHQLATLAAMRGGLAASLKRVSPATIRERHRREGFFDRLLPGGREAALWRAYEQEFEGVVRGANEAFMDVFAKEFRIAYEQKVAEMKSRRRDSD
jgi:type VI secretion system FHA domain protein